MYRFPVGLWSVIIAIGLCGSSAGDPPPVCEAVSPPAIHSATGSSGRVPPWRPVQFQLIRPNASPGRQPSASDPTETHLGPPQKFPVPAPPRAPDRPVSTTNQPPSSPPAVDSVPRQPQPSPAMAKDSMRIAWNRSYQSTARRPIETATFGTGPRSILIVGSIYGNEPESVELMDALLPRAAHVPADVTLHLVRTPNPDGLAERIRTNHNGVDLNRNFPSTWFTTSPTVQTGPHPASEIETQHLLRLLRETRPQRVIHVRGSLGQRPLVLMNQPWSLGFDHRMLPDNVDVGRFEGDFKAGSLEEFVTVRLRSELSVVHLPPRGFPQLKAEDLLGFSLGQAAAATDTVGGKSPPMSRTPVSEATPPVTSGGRKGPVEFLPPPPELESPTASSRYYELPPPPRESR